MFFLFRVWVLFGGGPMANYRLSRRVRGVWIYFLLIRGGLLTRALHYVSQALSGGGRTESTKQQVMSTTGLSSSSHETQDQEPELDKTKHTSKRAPKSQLRYRVGVVLSCTGVSRIVGVILAP